jgi:septum site-determining protein MinC
VERLRERVQGLMSRLGTWGKRLLVTSQEVEEADLPTSSPEEATRLREREQVPLAGITRPVRSVTPSQLSQPVRGQRPYLTESLSDTAPRRAERGSDMPRTPAERPASASAQPTEEAEGQVVDVPDEQGDEASAPVEPPPEQTEEERRALARKLLKGSRSGLLMTLEPEFVWPHVLAVLAASLADSPTFFHGSVLSVDTRRRPLEPQEVEELQALLAPYEMDFKEVGSDEMNDPRVLPSGAARPVTFSDTTPTLAIRASDVTNTLFTRRTIRSGQRLRYESSVVIIGDVNPGAEVIAGGDVMVWGTLRGTVHAGYPGNEEAVVCALALAPVQLRIGTLASRSPEDGMLPPMLPEVASVKNGQIVVESWNAGRASRR